MSEKTKDTKQSKSIAIELSRKFEELSFIIVEDCLKRIDIEQEKLTQEQKDGGYDGYFIIKLPNAENSDVVLMEAKLRSNVKSDLRLADFAKSVLISINELADSIYITTNLHFSKDTISKLSLFSVRTGLTIFPLDLAFIQEWLKKNGKKLSSDKYLMPVIAYLNGIQIQESLFHTNLLTNRSPDDNSQKIRIFGENRPVIWRDMIGALAQGGQVRNYIVSGPYGVGKTYFIQAATRGYNTIDLNLSYEKTYREIFLSIFFQLWTGDRLVTDYLTETSFDALFEKGNLHLSREEIQVLKDILFYRAHKSDLDELNTDILDNYLVKIITPILKRVKTVLYIHELHSLKDRRSERFVSRIIERLSGRLAIIIELDTDRLERKSDESLLYETCLKNRFQRIELREWEREDASQFLQFRNVPRALARNLVQSFGNNAAILDASLSLSDVTEQVHIASIIEDYSGINKIRYVSGAIQDILENTLIRQFPEMRKVFFIMQIYDGKIYAPISSEFYKMLIRVSNQYAFLKQDGDFFVIVKDAYLNAFTIESQHLEPDELHDYAQTALNDMQYYQLDEVQQSGKRLQIGMLCGENNLILDNYRFYVTYLHKQKAFPRAKKLLIRLYRYIRDGKLVIDSPNLFFILNLIIECYLNMGDGDTSIDEYLNDARELIEHRSQDWDSEEHFSYDKARYYKKNCGLCLRRGKYEDLVSFAEKGIELLQPYVTERCISMRYEFWNYKSLGIKHLYNLAESIQVYRDCLKDMQKLSPQLIRWFLSARASYYTYRNPAKAKALIKGVLKISSKRNYNPRNIAHHENNMGSLSFMTLELKEAKDHCLKAYEVAKEYSIGTEEARSQNLLGCLAWLDGNLEGAKDRLLASFNIFKTDSHETYTWIPLVNLSSLFMELDDLPSAYESARNAAKILLNSHAGQIARIGDDDLLFSKNYLALLQILRVMHEKQDDIYIEEILQKVACDKLKQHFHDIIKNNQFKKILEDSHVILNGHFMLKT